MEQPRTQAFYAEIPVSDHAKFKAYAALAKKDMKELFIIWIRSLQFEDLNEQS